MKNSDPKYYFAKNYLDSRTKFKEMIRQIPAPCQLGRWQVDSATDDDLFVDHAWLPPRQTAENLLVLISGIHGTETYAGAAVLTLFIEEILPEIDRDHLGILIVHAMNPYGFKNHRRCTENKVNLNRNFSVTGELFSKKNPESVRLNEMFLNRKPVASMRSRLLESLQRIDEKVFFGDILSDELIKGVSPGQFERADDLEYGGGKVEPQTAALMQKVQELMPQFQKIIALDLHTGLGHRGRLHLLTDGAGQSLDPQLFSQVFKPKEDLKYYEFTPPETEGFYSVYGATNSLFGDLRKPGQQVCAVTLEFGTLGHSLEQQISDFNFFLLDHEGYHYGFLNTDLEQKIRKHNFEKSYPDDDTWRTDILQAAEGLLKQVTLRLTT